MTRGQRDDGTLRTIFMRGGIYELKQTIRLTSSDSGLVITSYPGM